MFPERMQPETPNKVAVLYATFHEHTRSIAERIAADLESRGFRAEIHDVRAMTAFDPLAYTAAVLAAPVYLGRHHRDMVAFVTEHRTALEQLPTAFISVTLSEAGAEREFVTPQQRRQSVADVQMMLDRFVAETGWHPTRVKPVAGAIAYTRYNFLLRFGLKQIAKKAGAGLDTSRDYDYTDYDALDAFITEFSEQIRSASQVHEEDPVAV